MNKPKRDRFDFAWTPIGPIIEKAEAEMPPHDRFEWWIPVCGILTAIGFVAGILFGAPVLHYYLAPIVFAWWDLWLR